MYHPLIRKTPDNVFELYVCVQSLKLLGSQNPEFWNIHLGEEQASDVWGLPSVKSGFRVKEFKLEQTAEKLKKRMSNFIDYSQNFL